jgi:hypothetical protein
LKCTDISFFFVSGCVSLQITVFELFILKKTHLMKNANLFFLQSLFRWCLDPATQTRTQTAYTNTLKYNYQNWTYWKIEHNIKTKECVGMWNTHTQTRAYAPNWTVSRIQASRVPDFRYARNALWDYYKEKVSPSYVFLHSLGSLCLDFGAHFSFVIISQCTIGTGTRMSRDQSHSISFVILNGQSLHLKF